MTKRIRLTIEWDGACSEFDWACQVSDTVQASDRSGLTRVARIEYLTNHGSTPVVDARYGEQWRADRARQRIVDNWPSV